jgi:hypothetical protein
MPKSVKLFQKNNFIRKDGAVKTRNQPLLKISLVQKLSDRDPPAKFLKGADFWS